MERIFKKNFSISHPFPAAASFLYLTHCLSFHCSEHAEESVNLDNFSKNMSTLASAR